MRAVKPSGNKPLDHNNRPVPLLGGEGVYPLFDLVVEFNLEHQLIIADMRSSHESDAFDGRLLPPSPDPPIEVRHCRS